MDTVHILLWWTMYIDGQLARYIAAGNSAIDGRVSQSPIYCDGHCLSIDNVYRLTASPVYCYRSGLLLPSFQF